MEIPDQFSTEINKLEFLLRMPPDSAHYDFPTIRPTRDHAAVIASSRPQFHLCWHNPILDPPSMMNHNIRISHRHCWGSSCESNTKADVGG